MTSQPAILTANLKHASFLFFDLRHGVSPGDALAELTQGPHPDHLVVGLGATLLGPTVELPPLPTVTTPVSVPSTPTALMLRVSGDDPGQVLHRERALIRSLTSFDLVDRVDGFQFGANRDLSGYIDGTENPIDDDAVSVAFHVGPGLRGSSVVVVQRWLHDLETFDGMSREQQDHTFGRNRDTNEELADAPSSAHVKRTAQEDFEPEAFLVRRSMPWRDSRGAGLVFVSFSATLDPFLALLRRMTGQEDGEVDALFSFTRPVTGGSWWCPPMKDDRLDLSACLKS